MTVLGWVLFVLAALVTVSVLTGLLLGPVLKRNRARYPTVERDGWS